MENYKQGIFFGLAAYVLWGILPVYWKALELVSPFEILSSRFMWSCVFYPAGLCGPAFLCFCSLFFRKNGRFLPRK